MDTLCYYRKTNITFIRRKAMKKETETIAIYSRKSKFTGKGESIGNQIELCKEYIRMH